ncbi:MAG: accessory Sec system protein Asp1 [Lachnospiraceae bacterium]|nr:accessory Sec system protein Asp1 [Lachnospiraceae bacterium]
MLYFIPAWYQQNNWCENEQYWYRGRMHTEFDDTVKHIQLFQRSKAYPFKIMLLSFAPNFRHFLHRQSVFHAPYWSCFDAIQEIKRKKMTMFSYHNLNWPENIEFIYTQFILLAILHGKKYARLEFGEDGNLIQVDMYKNDKLQRRNIYDDRGFVSSTILYEDEKPVHQDYLNDKGVWKIRFFFSDGHVEVNPKNNTFLIEYQNEDNIMEFSKLSYENIEHVISEVLAAYLRYVEKSDLFCVAMHELHLDMLKRELKDKKIILSYYGERFDIKHRMDDLSMIATADYIIADSIDNLNRLKKRTNRVMKNITDITPFDTRVDFGISQQLNVQKILVPVDGMAEDRFKQLVVTLGEYLPTNENASVHLFTRMANFDRKNELLAKTRKYLGQAGMETGWALEQDDTKKAENVLDASENIPVKFFVEQCVDELSVSKCIREQRLIVDMRKNPELYLRITGLSVGIPQIIARETPFVEDGKNGFLIKDIEKVNGAISFYLDGLTNWNEAMIYSYEIGKKYTTNVLIDKWKEVIDIVRCD